jgi:hypothetical protein
MRASLGVVLLAVAMSGSTVFAQTAADQAQGPVASVVIPVVGSVVGANDVHWKTDLELVNTEGRPVTVAVELALDPDRVIIQPLAPGQRMRFTDVMGEAFGVDGMLSPLVVRTTSRRSVTIFANVYGTKGTETSPPQPIAINYGSTYFPRRVLPQLSFSDAYRTNIGLVNLGTEPVEFLLALQRVPGRNLAVTRVPLPPASLWHFSIQMAFPLITKGDHFSVVVETGSEATYCYASVIENETNSARFIAPTIGAQ